MNKGNKKTVEKEIEKLFVGIKLSVRQIPLEYLLQSFDKAKPLFSLKSIIISGKKRDFPIYLSPHKQFRLTTR